MKVHFNRTVLTVSAISLLSKLVSFSVYQFSILLISLGILLGLARRPVVNKRGLYLFWPILFVGFFYLISWMIVGGDLFLLLKLLFGVLITFITCLYFYTVGRSEYESSSFYGSFTVIFLVFTFMVLFADTIGESRELNSNFIGMVAVIVYLFFLMSKSRSVLTHHLFLMFLIVICLINEAKASFLVLLVGYLVFFSWKYCVRLPSNVFLLTLIISFSSVAIFIYLTSMSVIHVIIAPISMHDQAESLFYSGREDLWRVLIGNIVDSYWFGFGVGAQKMFLSGLANSAHNLFLQVFVQGGVGALISLLLFFFRSLWYLYRSGKCHHVSAAIVVSIFVLSVFEVFLIENNLILGLIFMSLLALSIGQADRRKKNGLSV